MEIFGLPYQRVLLTIVLIVIYNSVLLIFYYKSLKSYFHNSIKKGASISEGKHNKWEKLKSLDHNSMFIESMIVSGSSGFLIAFFEALVTTLYEGPYLWWVFGIVVSAFMVGYYLIVKTAVKPIMMKSIRNSY